jgi:hypothetical protein
LREISATVANVTTGRTVVRAATLVGQRCFSDVPNRVGGMSWSAINTSVCMTDINFWHAEDFY